MPKPIPALALCLMLVACASEPNQPTAEAVQTCSRRDPPVGTMVVRRESCVETSEEERRDAQRQIERMIDEQARTRNRKAPGGG